MKKGIALLLTLFFVACENNSVSDQDIAVTESTDGISTTVKVKFSDRNVPNIRQLTGQPLGISSFLGSPMSVMFNAPYLAISDLNEDSLIHIIDSRTSEYVKPLGQRGFGPNEIMTSMQSLSTKQNDLSSIWSYDAPQRRFSRFPLDIDNDSKLAVEQLIFKEGSFSTIRLAWTRDNSLLGLAIDGSSRLTEYDSVGRILAKYGDYDNLFNNRYPKPLLAQLYQGLLRSNSDNNKFVQSSIYVDKLEYFDLSEKRFVEIVGPLGIDPVFKEANVRGHPVLDIDVNETYHAYMDAFITNDKIYGLFSGKKWKGSPFGTEICTDIYVFDLDGTVLEKLELDEGIRAFTVDQDNGYVYGITVTENPDIIKFKL